MVKIITEEQMLTELNDAKAFAESWGREADQIVAEMQQLPPAERAQVIRNIMFRWVSMTVSMVQCTGAGWKILICHGCHDFYIQKRRTQKMCSKCARKLRNKNWREAYEKEHGRPYTQKREPGFVKKVRKLLAAGRNPKNKRSLAADANITVKQCEAALEIIAEEKKR